MKYLIILIMFILSIGNAFAKDYKDTKKAFDKMVIDRVGFSNQLEQYGITGENNQIISNYASMPYGYDFTLGQKTSNRNGNNQNGTSYYGIHYDTSYNLLNMDGLKDIHKEGWQGKGIQITMYEGSSPMHKGGVRNILGLVGKSAHIGFIYKGNYDADEVQEHVKKGEYDLIDTDITNHSYHIEHGFTNYAKNHFNTIDNRTGGDALHVHSTPNNITSNYCKSNANKVTDCDSGANAFVKGKLNGTHIFVGELRNDNLQSVRPGNNLKNDFIVADGRSGSVSAGSSFAAPRVAGAASILMQKYPELNASKIKNLLLFTADDLGTPGVDSTYGHGLLNIHKAASPFGEIN